MTKQRQIRVIYEDGFTVFTDMNTGAEVTLKRESSHDLIEKFGVDFLFNINSFKSFKQQIERIIAVKCLGLIGDDIGNIYFESEDLIYTSKTFEG